MKNYILTLEHGLEAHKVAISYNEDTSIKAVITLIKELVNRYYPDRCIAEVKGYSNYYKVITGSEDIYVYIEEIEGIFSLS